LGNHLEQQVEPLGIQLTAENAKAREVASGRARLATRPAAARSPPPKKTIGIVVGWVLRFFKGVQKKLREQGVRNVYVLGFQLTTNAAIRTLF